MEKLNSCSEISEEKFEEMKNWAIKPFENGLTCSITKTETQTKAEIRKLANKAEKKWGNKMICQEDNNNWTTLLGEILVRVTLEKLGKNPRKPKNINNYFPDWETDDAIWEVKTRNWTTTGTAGEKVLGAPYKYSDVPDNYKKQLYIVCVGYQEYELEHGKTRVFGDNISENKRKFLDLAKSMNIHYIKYTDLVDKLEKLNN